MSNLRFQQLKLIHLAEILIWNDKPFLCHNLQREVYDKDIPLNTCS